LLGDIIPFSPARKNLNILAQSILRIKKSQHTHFAVAIEQYCAIHAMPKQGVAMSLISGAANAGLILPLFSTCFPENQSAGQCHSRPTAN
jgi:hypothetical protein